ncbi:MAG: hypothetical protein J5620_01070 [Alphaproteobacteria bacterium]|nr:hypothetical protein [Alphaproteobacteria bacterium]
MINPKNVTKAQLIDLNNRFHGTIFGMALYLGIWLDDAEIKYIENKMQTHKLYRLVSGKSAGIDCRDVSAASLFKFQRDWLLGFMDDPELPIGVRAFIYYYVGHEQMARQYGKYDSISTAERFLAQRWMETCR